MRTRASSSPAAGVSQPLVKRPEGRTYGLSPERVACLRAIGQDPELGYRVLLSTIHRETVDRLESLAREVHEGKSVVEAANFARWLRFSGVLDLLTRFAAPDQKFSSLEPKITDLLQECGEHFRGGRVDPKYSASDIAEINRKLDVLMAAHSRQVVTTVVTHVHGLSPVEPSITVVKGKEEADF